MDIRGNIGELFVLSNGQIKDPLNLNSFHPLSTVNTLYVYIEDGGGDGTATMINYKADKLKIPNSHNFPMLYRGLEEHTISGEVAPRTFAKYITYIPTIVSRYNVNSKTAMPIQITLTQDSGFNFAGIFANITALNAYETPTELDIAYVTDNTDYGYYQYDGTIWEIMGDDEIVSQVTTKQYNMGYIQLQGGNAPSVPITTLTDEQYKLIWQYMETLAGQDATFQEDLNALELVVASNSNTINNIIDGTQDIYYDNSVSGLIATNLQDAIDEIDGNADDLEQLTNDILSGVEPFDEITLKDALNNQTSITYASKVADDLELDRLETDKADITYVDNQDNALDTRLDTAETEIVNLETFKDVTVPATYETIVNVNTKVQGAKNYADNGLSLKENLSNKSINLSDVNDIKYPTTQAVKTETDKKVNKTQTIIGIDLQDNILIGEFKTALGNATSVTSGLMTSQDKTHLDNLVSLLDTNDMNSVVDTIGEILHIFENYPEGANILEVLNDKVDKIEGKGLSENDYTDIDKNKVNLSYIHSEIVDGSNPHNTKFINIADKPTTRDGYGITDVYTKPETYTQQEINALFDNLSAVKGLKSTLLTPTELSNGNTISTNLLTNNGAYIVFTATDTLTEEIDSDTVPVSTIKTGKKFVFFDNQSVTFTIGETNSTFETSEDITLKINLLYLDYESVQAVDVDFDGSLTNYLLSQTNVQEAIEKLDNELKTTNDNLNNHTNNINNPHNVSKAQVGLGNVNNTSDLSKPISTATQSALNNKVDEVTGKGLSTEDYTTTEKNKLSGIEAGAEVNVQSDWAQEVNTADDYIKNKPAIPTKISDLTNDTGYITGYTETDPIFTAWDKSTGISITKSQVSDLIEATQSLSGLMSATDKQRLDALHALLEEDTANSVVDSINEILAIFNNYPEGADLVTALAGKVDKTSIVDNVTTDDATKVLSAKQGKVLQDTKEAQTNKAVDFSVLNDTKYPTTKAVKDLVDTTVGDIDSILDSILGV